MALETAVAIFEQFETDETAASRGRVVSCGFSVAFVTNEQVSPQSLAGQDQYGNLAFKIFYSGHMNIAVVGRKPRILLPCWTAFWTTA